MPTIYEIAQTIPAGKSGGRKRAPSIAEGLAPESFTPRSGQMRKLTPEQLCTLEVPVLARDNGGLHIGRFAGWRSRSLRGTGATLANMRSICLEGPLRRAPLNPATTGAPGRSPRTTSLDDGRARL